MNLFKTETFTAKSIPIKASSLGGGEIAGYKCPDGYKAIGVMSISMGTSSVVLVGYGISDTELSITAYNETSSDKVFNPTITCLFAKC